MSFESVANAIEPNGCVICEIPARYHGLRWHGPEFGHEPYREPGDAQRLARMRQRRGLRGAGLNFPPGK